MALMLIMLWMGAPQTKNSISFSSDDLSNKLPDKSYTKGTVNADLTNVSKRIFMTAFSFE